ncbi:uncharacterized protein LOC106177093 [Lingula anatina]|uniref:Uncharacterized protein LOC106177093 n=1 Tax=Lingula anatina TaxID=7574 RepID=A0A1S3JXT6_LINAN|nr:uncharacterized protein LOC106177093 [Lingula anatina]|eukprot:XP_013415225.1 uncharacterized protein LOC106177093 [Lingula anatina]
MSSDAQTDALPELNISCSLPPETSLTSQDITLCCDCKNELKRKVFSAAKCWNGECPSTSAYASTSHVTFSMYNLSSLVLGHLMVCSCAIPQLTGGYLMSEQSTIFIEELPIYPQEFRCISYNQERMECLWSFDNHTQETGMYFQYKNGDLKRCIPNVQVFANKAICMLTGGHFIKPATLSYFIYNQNKWGVTWKNDTLRTDYRIEKPNPVTGVEGSNINSTAVDVTWDPPVHLGFLSCCNSCPSNRGLLYTVHYMSRWNEGVEKIQYNCWNATMTLGLRLTGLHPFSEYNISVQVVPVGEETPNYGHFSEVGGRSYTVLKTKVDAPAAPPQLMGVLYQPEEEIFTFHFFWKEILETSRYGKIIAHQASLGKYTATHGSCNTTVRFNQTSGARTLPLSCRKILDDQQFYLATINAATPAGFASRSSEQRLNVSLSKKPRFFSVEIFNEEAHLSWQSPVDNQSVNTIIYYTVVWCEGNYTENKNCQSKIIEVNHTHNHTQCELSLPKSAEDYVYLVGAAWPDYNSTLVYPNCRCNYQYYGVPSTAPDNFTSVLNITGLRVSWKALGYEQSKGRILGYLIKYCEIEITSQKCIRGMRNISVTEAGTSALIEGLKPQTRYRVSVQAQTRAGLGPKAIQTVETNVGMAGGTYSGGEPHRSETVLISVSSTMGCMVIIGVLVAVCRAYQYTQKKIKMDIPQHTGVSNNEVAADYSSGVYSLTMLNNSSSRNSTSASKTCNVMNQFQETPLKDRRSSDSGQSLAPDPRAMEFIPPTHQHLKLPDGYTVFAVFTPPACGLMSHVGRRAMMMTPPASDYVPF